jgi:hypothetical protein
MKPALAVLFAALALLLTAGCAYNRPSMRTEERATNGVVRVSETSVQTFAIWPATSQLESQRVSNASKTQSVGTVGLDQQGGGTNLVEALKALDSILGKIR